MSGLVVDALAPTNYLPANPAALKRAFETGGASLAKGMRNFVDDLRHNNGRPRQVDTSPFTLGDNLAATPGQVVFRNELMELLQYSPQTDQVHATPLLFSPPWINKYYVMDLAPGRSFAEWAVQHQRTVFAISYRNPSADMSGITLDDYLIHGPQQALHVIQDITGAPATDPAYVVSAENDHIVPWRSAYATTGLITGPVRFVLSNGGHIAGIVNPPGPKGWYLVGKKYPRSADKWREKTTRHAGSWWQDWAGWSADNSGPLTDPPPMGSDTYPVLYEAPGEYVHG